MHRVCKCSCGCELKEDDGVYFDEENLCYPCDKGYRSQINDPHGRYLRIHGRHLGIEQ